MFPILADMLKRDEEKAKRQWKKELETAIGRGYDKESAALGAVLNKQTTRNNTN